jgi:tetratricopeptide (TPR) repeat protein
MPSGKILVRETYGADGTVACVTDDKKEAGGTPAPRRKILLAPCGAPELKPDAALVVLPLPLRSRQQAFGTRKLLADENYGSWSEEDALAAITADLGEGPVEMKQIIGQRFFRRGDRRVGFYTLLLSAGLKWNPKEKQAFQGGDPLLVDPLADHPHDPLAKYVAAYLASSQPGGPKDFGDPAESRSRRPEQAPGHPRYPLAGRGSVPACDFFRQLAEFHDLWERWHDGRATAGDEAQQRQEHQRVLAFIESAQPPEFGWGLLMAIRGVLPADTFHDGFAAAIPRFQTVPGLRYAARYELARACNAEDDFRKLFTETLETGIVPRIDGSFREMLQRGNGQQWQTSIRAAAKKLIDAGARQSAVYLAFQVQQVDDPVLAEEVFDMALCGVPESERLGLTLARIEHFRQTKQLSRADALLQTVLNDKQYADWPALWYLAEAIAGARGMTARAIGFRQRAMDIEFEHLPEKVNIEVIRNDYGQLLARYEKLATAIGPSHDASPPELLAGVIRAADRWRQLDTDPTAACQAAARVLGELGETDLAWDYLTTPLSVQANEAASWTNLAQMLRQQGHVDLADRAYVAACDAEPTNAQVLWDRAELLWENGRRDQARPLFRQIATGSWGPQFSALQSRAKQYVEK